MAHICSWHTDAYYGYCEIYDIYIYCSYFQQRPVASCHLPSIPTSLTACFSKNRHVKHRKTSYNLGFTPKSHHHSVELWSWPTFENSYSSNTALYPWHPMTASNLSQLAPPSSADSAPSSHWWARPSQRDLGHTQIQQHVLIMIIL